MNFIVIKDNFESDCPNTVLYFLAYYTYLLATIHQASKN